MYKKILYLAVALINSSFYSSSITFSGKASFCEYSISPARNDVFVQQRELIKELISKNSEDSLCYKGDENLSLQEMLGLNLATVGFSVNSFVDSNGSFFRVGAEFQNSSISRTNSIKDISYSYTVWQAFTETGFLFADWSIYFKCLYISFLHFDLNKVYNCIYFNAERSSWFVMLGYSIFPSKFIKMSIESGLDFGNGSTRIKRSNNEMSWCFPSVISVPNKFRVIVSGEIEVITEATDNLLMALVISGMTINHLNLIKESANAIEDSFKMASIEVMLKYVL